MQSAPTNAYCLSERRIESNVTGRSFLEFSVRFFDLKKLLRRQCSFFLIVHRIQRIVAPLLRQQLGVCALLDNLAVIEHDDQIGTGDGAQAVRDDKAGTASQSA